MEDFLLIYQARLQPGFLGPRRGCALHLVARLMQAFGVLLFTPQSRVQYRRIATDSLIMVRVCEETWLKEPMDGHLYDRHTVDVIDR